MGYHPRIESDKYVNLCTIRTRNSELWFINSRELENTSLGYLSKYRKRYGVKLYAFGLEGSHAHTVAQFPSPNRASFNRDLNSSIARAVPRHQSRYEGGRLWERRYSSEFLPGDEDVEEYFFYVVLQPVKDGLVDRISDYPGYNCFSDAVSGISRSFKVVNWTAYNEKKRWSSSVNIKDFTEIVTLRYERLPGYEHLSQEEYKALMLRKLEERRIAIIKARGGKPCVGGDALTRKRPGVPAKSPKRSTITSHRPRVLSVCHKRRHECREWYFAIYFQYKEASRRYREGEVEVVFPPGTYRPPPPGVVEA